MDASSLGDNELDLLKMLWEHGPGTVRTVNEVLQRQGRRWAYTTVLTLLSRLEAKGYATSDKSVVRFDGSNWTTVFPGSGVSLAGGASIPGRVAFVGANGTIVEGQ